MTRRPVLFGVHGPSGSGKTTLIERLVPLLRAHGLRVGTIKHVTHAPALDTPGKDSHRHAMAGAACVALVGAGTGAFFVHAGEPDDVHAWAALFTDRVDVVLVEGYRRLPMPSVALRLVDGPAALRQMPGDSLTEPWRLDRDAAARWPSLFPGPAVQSLADVIAGVALDDLPADETRRGRPRPRSRASGPSAWTDAVQGT